MNKCIFKLDWTKDTEPGQNIIIMYNILFSAAVNLIFWIYCILFLSCLIIEHFLSSVCF